VVITNINTGVYKKILKSFGTLSLKFTQPLPRGKSGCKKLVFRVWSCAWLGRFKRLKGSLGVPHEFKRIKFQKIQPAIRP